MSIKSFVYTVLSFDTMLLFIALLACTKVVSAKRPADGMEHNPHIQITAPSGVQINRNLRHGTVLATQEERGVNGEINLGAVPVSNENSEVLGAITQTAKNLKRQASITSVDEAEGSSKRQKVLDRSKDLKEWNEFDIVKNNYGIEEAIKTLYSKNTKLSAEFLEVVFTALYEEGITAQQIRGRYGEDDTVAEWLALSYDKFVRRKHWKRIFRNRAAYQQIKELMEKKKE